MMWAADLVRQYHGEHVNVRHYIEYVEDRLYNDTRYRISSEKVHKLGWRPSVRWEEGLRMTIEWYKEYRFRYFGEEELKHAIVAHPHEGRKSDFGFYRTEYV